MLPRSRGTPRIANRMLKRVRDFAQIISDGVITYQSAKIGLCRLAMEGGFGCQLIKTLENIDTVSTAALSKF